MTRRIIRFIFPGLLCLIGSVHAEDQTWQVGVAKIDITPTYPIRLTGYAARKTESQGVAQHLFAKAMAISRESGPPVVLVTVDNCGVPGALRDEVALRLHKKKNFDPTRLAVCSTHTHCGPWVNGFAPNIFGAPIPPDEQKRVDRYTRELTDAIEKAASQALDGRQPALLKRGLATAGFAANRRTKGGPVDHDLPVLFVTAPDGALRAVFGSYACHCTTLGAEFNLVCGDWAGYAQESIEREHPGAVAFIALGCAGDSNPDPRSKLELAERYGQEIASAADGLLGASLTVIKGDLVCRTKRIELPFDALPTRAEWKELARQTNFAGAHARLNLARLRRGEALPTKLPYLVQTWTFGDNLAMVFLPGEAVVDYSLRLKREFDRSRLWINAYANDVPCYIPSERILTEGGYEGGGAMVYYDRPAPFAHGIENLIVGAVHKLLPVEFSSKQPQPN